MVTANLAAGAGCERVAQYTSTTEADRRGRSAVDDRSELTTLKGRTDRTACDPASVRADLDQEKVSKRRSDSR
jgi:hypothetical protein